jgi:hypothetical protein
MRYTRYTQAQWDGAIDEARRILTKRAQEARTIAYSELAQKIAEIEIDPASYAMGGLLAEISEESDAHDKGMLSVLVVHKDGDQRPGGGFFDLAKKLGRETSDRDRCWIEEFDLVVSAARGNVRR